MKGTILDNNDDDVLHLKRDRMVMKMRTMSGLRKVMKKKAVDKCDTLAVFVSRSLYCRSSYLFVSLWVSAQPHCET
jgi:hypothetical protein